MSELEYEPRRTARPVIIERDERVTRILVPMDGIYAPAPRWTNDLDLFSLIVVPIWKCVSLAVRFCLKRPKPPRVIFEINNASVKMEIRDQGTGEVSSFNWPRSAVLEIRKNRYDSGLWVDVSGVVKDTFLKDLSTETIDRLDAVFAEHLVDQNKV